MNFKKAGIIFLLILVLAFLFLRKIQEQSDPSHTLRQRGFDRRIALLNIPSMPAAAWSAGT